MSCAKTLVSAVVLEPIVALVLLCGGVAHAAEFYIDPATGAADNDGSAARPWQTLEAVVAAGHFGSTIQAGDRVWLQSGYHGALVVRGASFATPVQISAAPGQTPRVSHVSMSQTSGWVVSGLTISPSYDATLEPLDMVLVDASSKNVVIEGCRVFSVEDASSWSAADWINLPSNGAFVRGTDVTVRNCTFTNVRFGISVDGANALIQNNQVVNFSADGMRGLGDNGIFEYNLVKNVYVDDAAGDTNHDDGFQSWSVGPNGPGDGVVTGVVLRGNVFLNREDPNQRFPNAMQGIGCFDGMFDGWVVENNVVITDHWHGISFYGMRNSRIVNNTVIDVNDTEPGPPWIMVTAHKSGTVSENVVVRNNLATDFSLEGTQVVDDHNTTLTTLDAFFVNPAKFDLHLLPNSPAIDTGSSDQAPPLDADRISRPQGAAVDLGAYEWHEVSVTPVGGNGGVGNPPGTGGTNGGLADGRNDNESGCGCRVQSMRADTRSTGTMLILVLGAVGRSARRKGRTIRYRWS